MAKLMNLVLSSLFLSATACAAPGPTTIRVGIIDTGLDMTDQRFTPFLCRDGHRDYTGTGLKDEIGHGTHVAGLIKEHARDADFCLIIVKVFTPNQLPGDAGINMAKAMQHLRDVSPSFINISASGQGKVVAEAEAIMEAQHITFVAAAGNDNLDLDAPATDVCLACYTFPNVLIVGSVGPTRQRSKFSNYGRRVSAWEMGENVLSALPGGYVGKKSGTSMSTAIHTGKLVNESYRNFNAINIHSPLLR